MSDEDKKYLAEKHNKGVFINDCTHDWGGCPSTYEDQPETKDRSNLNTNLSSGQKENY